MDRTFLTVFCLSLCFCQLKAYPTYNANNHQLQSEDSSDAYVDFDKNDDELGAKYDSRYALENDENEEETELIDPVAEDEGKVESGTTDLDEENIEEIVAEHIEEGVEDIEEKIETLTIDLAQENPADDFGNEGKTEINIDDNVHEEQDLEKIDGRSNATFVKINICMLILTCGISRLFNFV